MFADSVGRRFVPDGDSYLYVAGPRQPLRLATAAQREAFIGLTKVTRRKLFTRGALAITTMILIIATTAAFADVIPRLVAVLLGLTPLLLATVSVHSRNAARDDLVFRWPVAAPAPDYATWLRMTWSPAALARMGAGGAIGAAVGFLFASFLALLWAAGSVPLVSKVIAVGGVPGFAYVLTSWFWGRFRS
jgi:hypothetical protein